VLVVSEDPAFIFEVEDLAISLGMTAAGCLGPGHSVCPLDQGFCPMASHSTVVLVDSPPSGCFGRRWDLVPAGTYAERLAKANLETFVILCGAPIGRAGPTGEVAHVRDRAAALEMLRWVAQTRAIV
jgi:hypothetical protein